MRFVAVAAALTVLVLGSSARAQQAPTAALNHVTRVEVSGDAVEIGCAERPNFTTLTLSAPPRLVIDFADTVLGDKPHELAAKIAGLKGVRTEAFRSDTGAVARVVLTLDPDADTDISAAPGNTLRVQVIPPHAPGVAARKGDGAHLDFAQADADATRAKQEAAARAKEEAEAKVQAESKARADAEAKAQAESKARADAEAKAQAESKAREEAEAKARAAEARLAQLEASKKASDAAREQAEAKAQLEARARAEAEARAKADREREAQARADAAEKARIAEELKHKQEQALAAEELKHKQEQAAAEQARQAQLAIDKQRAEEARVAAQRAEHDRQVAAEKARQEALQAEQDRQAQLERARSQRDAQHKLDAEAAAQKQHEADRARAEAEAEARAEAQHLAAQREAERNAHLAEARAAAASQPIATRSEVRVASAAPTDHVAVRAGLKDVSLVGFRQTGRGGRVFIKANDAVNYTVTEASPTLLVVEVHSARISQKNGVLPLDTSFFPGPVALVSPTEDKQAHLVRVEIRLKSRAAYSARLEGSDVVVDFPSE